jgi:hypothetical protein
MGLHPRLPTWCLRETYEKWQRLQSELTLAQKNSLKRPDLIPAFAWYAAYAEQSFRTDKQFNQKIRLEKEETLRQRRVLVRGLFQRSKPVAKALGPLVEFLENPTSGTKHEREYFRSYVAGARTLLVLHEHVTNEHQRLNGVPVLRQWEDPDHGQANVNFQRRHILISVERRTLHWWQIKVGPEYTGSRSGKLRDMLILAEQFGVLRTKDIASDGERVLRKLIRDASKAAATSNLIAPPPPGH